MQVKFKTHKEEIICPECNTIQMAEVEHSIPFWTYIHECINCKNIILESEWITTDNLWCRKCENKIENCICNKPKIKDIINEKISIVIPDKHKEHYNKIIEIDNSDLEVYDYLSNELDKWLNRNPFWLSDKEKDWIDKMYDVYVF